MIRAVAFAWLLVHGYPSAPAAAIVANLEIESGLDPTAVSPTGAAGMPQYEGSRRRALLLDAVAAGVDWRNPEFQLAWLDRELKAMAISRRFLKITDPASAAIFFARHYERPRGAMTLRAKRAAEIYREQARPAS